jgi:beta-lactamase regulating signal transducer with metallopeptidase domain
MIAAVMLYATAISLIFAAAAFTVEGLLRQRRLPTRGVWAAALLASLILPVLAVLLEAPASRLGAHQVTSAGSQAGSEKARRPASHLPTSRALLQPPRNLSWPTYPEVDSLLVALWALSSIGALGLLAAASIACRHNARRWRPGKVCGVSLFIAERTGPAVFGVVRPRIVIPAWLTEAPCATQAIVVDHEQEHIAARDPMLVAAALILVALAPWNAPLWWQLRRLRFAIETDCDSRLLGDGVDAVAYGEALLAVGRPRSGIPLGAMAMIESVSQLERRVRLMIGDTPRRSAVLTGALVALVLALGATAAELAPPAMELRKLPPAPGAQSFELGQRMAAVVAERYPQLLNEKTNGVPLVTVLFKRDGSVDRSRYQLLGSEKEFKPTEESYARRLGVPAEEIQYVGLEGVRSPSTGQTILVAFTERKQPGHLDSAVPDWSNVVKAPDTREIDRLLVERYFANALEAGVAANQRLWVLFDSEGRVLRTGIDTSSGTESVLKDRFPGIETQYETATPVTDQTLEPRRDLGGQPLQLLCIWLKKGSPVPRGS